MSEHRRAELTAAFLECVGPRIALGPFQGMEYVSASVGSELLPKLLGCYEQELHGLLDRVLARNYRTLVNIGCGEGYYAVGIARRLPGLRVVAFDSDPRALALCRELAVRNGAADRLTLVGECTVEALREHLQPDTLVICDCEGAEVDLLRPELLPELYGCDLLVETHDHARPGATIALLERFAESHASELFRAEERQPQQWDALLSCLAAPSCPALTGLSPEDKALALSESRPPGMRWLYFEARGAGAASGVSKPSVVVESAPMASPGVLPGLGSRSLARTILIQSARGEQVCLLELTRSRHEAYAHRHGIEYDGRIGYTPSGRHAGWDKIAVLGEVLRENRHDLVVWMDADTLVVDPGRDLREALPSAAWLGMVQHGNPPYYNHGVMIVRNCAEAIRFLEAVWREWPVHHPWEDNEGVLRVLRRGAGHWPGVVALPDEWNSTVNTNESPNPVVLAWHGFGSTACRHAAMTRAIECLDHSGGYVPATLPPRDRARGIAAPPSGLSSLATPRAAVQPLDAPRPAPRVPRRPANPLQRDPPSPVDFRALLGRPLRVAWEEELAPGSEPALFNRELCLALLAGSDVELSLSTEAAGLLDAGDRRCAVRLAQAGRPLSGPPDVTVRHSGLPACERPANGKLVVIQPCDDGHLPAEWVRGAARQADEVWVPARSVRAAYARSGVPAEKVRLLLPGFRPDLFSPNGPRSEIPTGKATRFLFVGPTDAASGADLLLAAYRQAFRREDDACLVAYDPKQTASADALAASFQQAAGDPLGPEVIHIETRLTGAERAALYRACTCVVMPSRGASFALPSLEGVACGLPAIVTAGGPADDFLDDTMALRVPSRRVPAGQPYAGPHLCVDSSWTVEPDLDALTAALRWVYERPEEARERGHRAREWVQGQWTWDQTGAVARAALADLVRPTPTDSDPKARPWTPPGGKRPSGSRRGKRLVEISLCMIVRDEEDRIAECLRSASPYVEEINVVDTGSRDRTREIAHACGARVFEMEWPDSFAAARNASLAVARGRWIFWMDADDILTPQGGEILRRLVREHPACDRAFHVQVRIPPGPGEYHPSLVDHVKLFPNRPDVRFEFRIHEQVLPSLREAGIPVDFSDAYVVHQNYDRSAPGQTKKRRRDFRLLELELRDRPDHPFGLFNMGMTCLQATREFEVAAQLLRRSLDASHPTASIVRKAYAYLTTCYTCLGDWPEAAAINEEGRSHYPEDAELLFQAAQIYQELGRLEEAHAALVRLIKGTDDPHYRSVDDGLRTYRGRHELALLYHRTRQSARGIGLLQEIWQRTPSYLPAQLDLVELHLAAGQHHEAIVVLRSIPAAPGLEADLRRLRVACGLTGSSDAL